MKELIEKKEHWKISFLDDFVYKKNSKHVFFINARVVLQKLSSNLTKTVFFNINQLYDKIIESSCDSEGNVISNDINRSLERIIFKVEKSDLNKTSQKLNHYKEFNLDSVEIQNFINEILDPNDLYKKLHYAPVHLLKSNKKDNEIDFFILPSYEVMRYFFLKGSKLNKFLWKKFLLANNEFDNNNNELYVKFDTNEDVNGNYLRTKQGFSDSEYKTICRMAYIKNGYKCVEEIRKSLLISSQKNIEYEYKVLKTIIPQDEPFEMLCTGKRFKFRNKNYFLINQIHGTKENLPIKDITLLFFTDRRRNKNNEEEGGNNGENGSKGKKKRNLKKTKPEDNAKLTSEVLGNEDIAADVEFDYFNDNSFQGDEFNIEKVEKVNGKYRYLGTTTKEIPKGILSLLDGIDKNSNAGRANTHSHGLDNSDNNEFRKMRREIFYDAIEGLKSNICNVYFFQIDNKGKTLLLNKRTLVEPYNEKPLFETIICQICIEINNTTFYLYIAKSDSHQDEISRYAIFNYYFFKKFDLSKLKNLYDDKFSKEGLRFKVQNLTSNDYNLKYSLEFHNQSDNNEKMLKDKIEREIEKKLKELD